MVALTKTSPHASRGVVHGRRSDGSSTSAASASLKSGTRVRDDCMYIPGEGWVKLAEIKAQVREAYEHWRFRCAMKGRRVVDPVERFEAAMKEGRRRAQNAKRNF